MKKIITSAVILLLFSTITEAKVKNNIIYDNKVFDLCCNLLDPQYIKTGDSDWSNYGSVWEIKENTLYLLGIDNNLPAGYKKADMKELFGDKYINGKVKAEWFTGKIRVPDGKLFTQINNEYTYERDNIIYVTAGEITKKIVIDNTIKKDTDKTRSMLTPIIDPDKSIFGIPYGTGEDEFIAKFGRPMRINKSGETGREMLYGKKYIFLFDKKKLVGMKTIASEHEVYQVIPTHNTFDYLEWKLSNGITQNMNRAEVKKILEKEGFTTKEIIFNLPIEAVKKVTQFVIPSRSADSDQRELTNEKGLQFSFSTKKAYIEIRLKHLTKRENIVEAYTVSEILVRLK